VNLGSVIGLTRHRPRVWTRACGMSRRSSSCVLRSSSPRAELDRRPRKPFTDSSCGGRDPQGRARQDGVRVQWLRSFPDQRHRLGSAARSGWPLDDDYEEFPRAVRVPSRLCGPRELTSVWHRARTALVTTGVMRPRRKRYPVSSSCGSSRWAIAWAAGCRWLCVISLRGGDFELTLGEDFSIGSSLPTPREYSSTRREASPFRAHSPERRPSHASK